ncbi:MAG: DUF2141 domain-containing protein [Rubripirellula sp.]
MLHKRKGMAVIVILTIAAVGISVVVSGFIGGNSPAASSGIGTSADNDHEPSKSMLTLEVSGIRERRGKLKVAVFDQATGFPDHKQAACVQSFAIESKNDQSNDTFQIDALLPGDYVIAVYQDIDENGEMNRALIGYPTEPYGFSNNARATFGPPEYAQAVFNAAEGDQTLSIEIH